MKQSVCVHRASGEGNAQQVRAFLRAYDIHSELKGEALRLTHSFTIDGLGEVQVLVSAEDAPKAKELLEQVRAGELELAAADTDGDSDSEAS